MWVAPGLGTTLTPQSEQNGNEGDNNRIARHFVLGVAAIPQPFSNSKLAIALRDPSRSFFQIIKPKGDKILIVL